MGLTVSHEVLSLALRDPFRIARSEPGAGERITTVVVELRDERFPGVIGIGAVSYTHLTLPTIYSV